EFHHPLPPHKARPNTPAPSTIDPLAHHTRPRVGASPGGKTLSRVAAPTSEIIATSNTPAHTPNIPPNQRGISFRDVAMEFTGTTVVPMPPAPSALTTMLYAPEFISQRSAVKRFVSPRTSFAKSAPGAPFVPVSHRAGRTETRLTLPSSARTEI